MGLFVFIHVLICIFLVTVILLQPGKSDGGIGFGSSSQSIFGSKGAGNFLTKITSFCAFFFIVASFFLSRDRIIAQRGMNVPAEPNAPASTTPAPATAPAPAVPPADAKKGTAPATTTQPAKSEGEKKK